MFYYFYKRYKIEVLNAGSSFSFRDLKLYVKISLVMLIGGGILSAVFTLLDNNIGEYISTGIIIAGLAVTLLVGGTQKEQQRVVKEVIEPSANEKMKKMIKLLRDFNIDISNNQQLNQLIELVEKEQTTYDLWGKYKQAFSKMITYVLLPITTIFLSELLSGVEGEELLMRTLVVALVCILGGIVNCFIFISVWGYI